MIKRALAATLCLIMVFALLPKTARADTTTTETLYFSGSQLHIGSESGAVYDGEGTTWSGSGSTLTLTGFDFSTSAANALVLPAGTTLVLNGINKVKSVSDSSDSSDAIKVANGNLTIQGPGMLTATGGTCDSVSTGINVGGNLIILGGSVTGKGGTTTQVNCCSIGVYVQGNLTVSGGMLTGEGGHATALSGDSCGVHATGGIEAKENGTIKGKGGTSEQARSLGVETGDSGIITVNSGGSITGEGGVTIYGQSYGVKTGELSNITVKENGYLQGKAQTAPNGSYGIDAYYAITLDQNATTLAQGYSQALHIADTGTLQVSGTAVASENYDGSGAGSYVSTNNNNYKYFRMPAAVQATQITVTQDSFPFGQVPENETITVTSNLGGFNATNSFGRAMMDGQ